MSTNTDILDGDYSAEELLEMTNDEFREEACAEFKYTVSSGSPFLDPRLITRTYHVLHEALSNVDVTIAWQAEDPSIPVERYRRTVSFRASVLWALTVLEGHPNWPIRMTRDARIWRMFANEIADAIEGTALDHLLDTLKVPGVEMTAREWVTRRRIKNPSRVPVKEV